MLPVAVELERLMTLFTDMRKWLLSPAIEELFLQIPGLPQVALRFLCKIDPLETFLPKAAASGRGINRIGCLP